MSSLAASKSDNFYFPPDWRPEYGGISKFQGSTGANQYQKYGIIRFELPFDAWCLKCQRHMSKGLRFNAKKDAAGKYYSTTIWSFSMKCYSCDQNFIIKTNPQERTYDFVEGLRKHEQDYEPDQADGAITILSEEEKLRIEQDPMYKLQHVNEDELKAKTTFQQLTELQHHQETVTKRDYDINAVLRKQNRTKRHTEGQERAKGMKFGVSFPVKDFNSEKDQPLLKNLLQRRKDQQEEQINREIAQGNLLSNGRNKILSQSIFSTANRSIAKKEKKRSLELFDASKSEKLVKDAASSNSVDQGENLKKKKKVIDLQKFLSK